MRFLLILLFCAQAFAAAPNIVIIVADDLGYGDAGFNGGKAIKTPNLDRLAATGVKLADFRVAPVCSPTRAGLLTGRWPHRFGMMRAVVPPWSKFGIPAEEKTLAEALGEAGYEKRALMGKWHLGHARQSFLPLANGFTEFYGHYNGAIDYFTHEREGEMDWHRNEKSVREEGYSVDLIAAEAAKFICAQEKPWFLCVTFNAPHSPFQATPERLKKYAGLKKREQTYAAMVDAMDEGVGKILSAVEAHRDAENTIVWFLSDNGGAPNSGSSNEPWRGDKATVYEGGTRAAAAIRWPAGGLSGGKVFAERIGYIDVMPTLLAASGGNFDGMNILPAMRGEKALPQRAWFSYIHQNANQPGHASVHLRNWKLVAHGTDVLNAPAAVELYDLKSDPAEKTDVGSDNAERLAELRTELKKFASWNKEGVGPFGQGQVGFKAPKDWIVED